MILRHHFPQLLHLILQPRTRLRLLQVRLALLRLATPLRITRTVLQGHREPLRLRTIRAVGHLIALQPRTTLAALRGQVKARLPVTRLLTELAVEHLAQQPRPLVTQLVTQPVGRIRRDSLLLERIMPIQELCTIGVRL